MSVVITEAESVTEIPKRKKIAIGDFAVGEAEPSINGDRLSWMASISPVKPTCCLLHRLYGHGPSVRSAIATSILSERREINARIEFLAMLEKDCGTTSLTVEELAAKIRDSI